MEIIQLIATVAGTSGLTSAIMAAVQSHMEKKSITRQTMAVLTYSTLADKIEKLLDNGYAAPEQRKEIEQLYKLYKAHGWNGDMEARMEKVYDLPTKELH